jgi:LPS O-antigen subunit length determinant protein (WzzB/FepE family)
VALSYRSSAPALARGCLEAVLQDVLDAQSAALGVSKGLLSNERLQVERQLDKLRSDQIQLEDARRDSLVAVQEQLQQTRTALQSLDAQLVPQSSQADAVNVLMLLNLRGDVQQLESALLAIQTTLNAARFDSDTQTVTLSERLTNLSAALEAPSTQSARYVTGISAPDSPVAPRRSLIVVIGVLIGGFAGLMLLIGRRAIVHIRAHEAQRRARSAS